MNDPRNTAHTPSPSVDWQEPSAEETGEIRQIVDLHRLDRREYLRRVRGEVIEVETDAHGCEITTDTTGPYPVITLECPEDAE